MIPLGTLNCTFIAPHVILAFSLLMVSRYELLSVVVNLNIILLLLELIFLIYLLLSLNVFLQFFDFVSIFIVGNEFPNYFFLGYILAFLVLELDFQLFYFLFHFVDFVYHRYRIMIGISKLSNIGLEIIFLLLL